MTGMSARGHGDRNFHNSLRLPEVPTLVQCFRDAGYQTSAVGKLHVYPQRSRIGFDEVILNEEGRHTDGMSLDDWERFLVDAGYPGQEYAAGGCNNDYHVTPWHLPDHCHPTNWTAREMCRTITRRDPDRPAFWYLSFTAPHPPLWPLGQYLEQYQKMPMAPPAEGDWVKKFKGWNLSRFRSYAEKYAITTGSPDAIALSRRAFYAMVTHVDHQIRVVLGTLREAGLLDNTIVAFTSDHGEMLGAHSLWAKAVHYEPSISVPFIIAPPASWGRPRGVKDDRLVELRDLMPTLLELADLPVPKHVEGLSAFSSARRSEIYGEYQSGINATRMIRESTFKLIYYPEGNRFQLFDLTTDPKECRDLACDSEHTETLERMKTKLATELYDGDEDWIKDGQWVGLSESQACVPQATDYGAQRGLRFL